MIKIKEERLKIKEEALLFFVEKLFGHAPPP
jgi:hypothetical protein